MFRLIKTVTDPFETLMETSGEDGDPLDVGVYGKRTDMRRRRMIAVYLARTRDQFQDARGSEE